MGFLNILYRPQLLCTNCPTLKFAGSPNGGTSSLDAAPPVPASVKQTKAPGATLTSSLSPRRTAGLSATAAAAAEAADPAAAPASPPPPPPPPSGCGSVLSPVPALPAPASPDLIRAALRSSRQGARAARAPWRSLQRKKLHKCNYLSRADVGKSFYLSTPCKQSQAPE